MNDDTIKYAVVNPSGQHKTFTTWHESLELAQAEAVRLATQHHTVFLVVQTVGYAMPATPPIKWVECTPK